MGFLSNLFGGGPKTTVVQSRIPEEMAPYVKEVLGDTKALYEQRMGEGYTPYTGQTIADMSPDQLAAQQGIKGLVGTQAPMYQEALQDFKGGREQFTPEAAQQYMSPYQQAVIDVEKRKAQEDYEQRLMPQFEKQAVEAGGMSGMGSRAGVQAAIMGGQHAQRLGDIQTKGLQKAYEDARRGFTEQKQRERQVGQDIATTAPQLYGAQIKELAGQEAVGAQQQKLEQKGLDKAYAAWLEEQEFPEQQLARYTSSIYGNPMLRTPSQTTTSPGTPVGQQLLGLGTSFLGGWGSALGKAGKNPFGFEHGGYLGGLADLPEAYRNGGGIVYRQENNQVGRPLTRFQRQLEKRAKLDKSEIAKKQNLRLLEELAGKSPEQQKKILGNPDMSQAEFTATVNKIREQIKQSSRPFPFADFDITQPRKTMQNISKASKKEEIDSTFTPKVSPTVLDSGLNIAQSDVVTSSSVAGDTEMSSLPLNLRLKKRDQRQSGIRATIDPVYKEMSNHILKYFENKEAVPSKKQIKDDFNKGKTERKELFQSMTKDIRALHEKSIEAMKELITGTRMKPAQAWAILGASIATNEHGALAGAAVGIKEVYEASGASEEKYANAMLKLEQLKQEQAFKELETTYQYNAKELEQLSGLRKQLRNRFPELLKTFNLMFGKGTAFATIMKLGKTVQQKATYGMIPDELVKLIQEKLFDTELLAFDHKVPKQRVQHRKTATKDYVQQLVTQRVDEKRERLGETIKRGEIQRIEREVINDLAKLDKDRLRLLIENHAKSLNLQWDEKQDKERRTVGDIHKEEKTIRKTRQSD